MDELREKRLLQAVMVLGCIVPITGGLLGIIYGASWRADVSNITLDSHVRYLSGLLLAIGLGFLSAIPTIEKQSARVSVLSAIVIVGGLARLYGVAVDGWPAPPMVFALVMELGVVPLLWLWQKRIARRASA